MNIAKASSHAVGALLGRANTVPGVSIAIVASALVAWLILLLTDSSIHHVHAAPSNDMALFLIGWVLMLTAMMLPSELTYTGTYLALLKARGKPPLARHLAVASFLAGYAIVWVGYGLVALLLDAAMRQLPLEAVSWHEAGPFLAGAVLAGAGLYQVSPLKGACLDHCRAPLAFFARHWREGSAGALAMGIRHGIVCAGCCWAMMAVMFAVGAADLTWMALLTLFMFAEKVLPHGEKLAWPTACFFVAMGVWIAASAESAPWVHMHHH